MKGDHIPTQVPFLPGNSFNDPYKQKFNKGHVFDKSNYVQTESTKNMMEEVDPQLVQSMREGEPKTLEGVPKREEPENEGIPRIPPKWLKYDKKVLLFKGYFKEPVHESAVENYRVRKIDFHYYLDDDTMYITEEKIENSGIPQGVFLKRHKVPKGDTGEFYTQMDLNIGIDFNVYGRVFRIVDCDEFTKSYYQELGIALKKPEEYPVDLNEKNRVMTSTKIPPPDAMEIKEYVEVSLKGGHPNKNMQKFLENDRKVLCFDALWQDKAYDGGDKYYKVDFFLSDESVEVKEINMPNSGKDPFPKMLRRQKLAKNPTLTHCPGLQIKKDECYKAADLSIGKKINIYGREMMLFNCDDFTKSWYKINMNVDMIPIQITKPPVNVTYSKAPPYNGFGTEEDSMGYIKNLNPKVPKKDYAKMYKNEMHILRFKAKLASNNPYDEERNFTLLFYCGDDTIKVTELKEKNSGWLGGKFLEKNRHKNPVTGNFYTEKDMVIGALLILNSFKFRLIECDEYSEKYMEQNPESFPQAAFDEIINKIKAGAKNFPSVQEYANKFVENVDKNKDGKISIDEFAEIVKMFNVFLTTQEMHCIMRKLDYNGDGTLQVKEIADFIFKSA